MSIHGYRLSLDKSLVRETLQGQQVIPTDEALAILAKIKDREARVWETLIRGSDTRTSKQGIAERMRSKESRNWSSLGN